MRLLIITALFFTLFFSTRSQGPSEEEKGSSEEERSASCWMQLTERSTELTGCAPEVRKLFGEISIFSREKLADLEDEEVVKLLSKLNKVHEVLEELEKLLGELMREPEEVATHHGIATKI